MSNRRISLGPSLAKQTAANDRNLARWNGYRKWNWRDYLTDEELETLSRADAAKAEWKRLNQERALITNRALQRAKHAAGGQAYQRRRERP